MFLGKQGIQERIPHRDPFLFVEEVLGFDADTKTIECRQCFSEDLDVFRGHYPNKPIVPGVLLSESIFQSGALLMSLLADGNDTSADSVPVLTRIGGAKYKRFAGPGDILLIKVEVVETIASATLFKGKLYNDGKLAVQIEFTCAMVEK